MYEETLKHAGLSRDQASVYEILIKNGALTAGELSKKSPLKRGLVYMILGQLETMGLVSKSSAKKITSFEPAHPIRLKELAEQKEIEARNAQIAVSGILNQLSSDFNLSSGKPGVIFYEGERGIKKIYDDTIESNASKKVLVFRSSLDDKILGLDFFNQYSQKRAHAKIQTQLISSKKVTAELEVIDKKLLKERKFWDGFETPAEIDIYDDKVAIISFENKLVGTIIENKPIAETFKKIFDQVWKSL